MAGLPLFEKLSGFILLFEALVLMLCRQMTFAAVPRLAGESRLLVATICERNVELVLAQADFSASIAIHSTTRNQLRFGSGAARTPVARVFLDSVYSRRTLRARSRAR